MIGPFQPSRSIVHIQPVHQGGAAGRKLAASAGDVEVEVAVPVGIEPGAVGIFGDSITLQRRLRKAGKTAPRVLYEDGSGGVSGSAQIEVRPPVTVHVPGAEGRTFRRSHMEQQRCASKVVEVVLPVLPLETPRHRVDRFQKGRGAAGRVLLVGERRTGGRRPVRSVPLPPVQRRMSNHDAAIHVHLLQEAALPVRPAHDQRVEPLFLEIRSQSEMQRMIDGRLKTANGVLFHVPLPPRRPGGRLRADGVRIRRPPFQVHLQPRPIGLELGSPVAKDERPHIDVVDDEIEISVVVQISVGRSVREARRRQSPRLGHVLEPKIPASREHVVGDRIRGNHLDQSLEVDVIIPDQLIHRSLVSDLDQVIGIRQILVDSVRHEQVPDAVQVEVGDESAPAPVGGLYARHASDLAELDGRRGCGHGRCPSAPVQMERVARKLVEVIVPDVIPIALPGIEGGHGLEPVLVLRQHVGDEDLRVAVAVQIGHVRSHRRCAHAPDAGLQHLAEGPILVVEVQIIAFEEVVRHVQVGPAVAIHVPYGDAQTEPDLAAVNPSLFTDVDEVRLGPAAGCVAARRRQESIPVKPVAAGPVSNVTGILTEVEASNISVGIVHQI